MTVRLDLKLCADDGTRFFGAGPCRLLRGIQELGSLRAAALRMGMAYTKAFHMVKRAEAVLRVPLIQRTIGGKCGGGSVLTPEAEELLLRYEQYRDDCAKMADQLYQKHFSDFRPAASAADRAEELRQNHDDKRAGG